MTSTGNNRGPPGEGMRLVLFLHYMARQVYGHARDQIYALLHPNTKKVGAPASYCSSQRNIQPGRLDSRRPVDYNIACGWFGLVRDDMSLWAIFVKYHAPRVRLRTPNAAKDQTTCFTTVYGS